MKKYLALFMMSLICLLSLQVHAATRQVYINIDNHEAVYLEYYDASYNTIQQTLSDGLNIVPLEDPYGYGASFQIKAVDGFYLKKVLIGTAEEDLWDTSSYYGNANDTNGTATNQYYITTGGAAAAKSHVTINVDDPSLVTVCNATEYAPWNGFVSLSSGSNSVEFTTCDAFFIRNNNGGEYPLTSVKYNGKEVSYITNQGYLVQNVTDGSTIDIIAVDPNAVKYHISFAIGTNTDAIEYISVNGSQINGAESGFDVSPGNFVSISFKSDYNISDITVNGVETEMSYGSLFVSDIQSDQVISYTATLAAQTKNTVTFIISGPTAGLQIHHGSSEWDTELDLSANFTDEFDDDTQQYFIKANPNYKVTQITKNSKTVSLIGGGTTVEVADGDVIAITVVENNPEALRTATLTVNLSSTKYFDEAIYINSGALTYGDILSAEGQTIYKFNPNDTNERTFRITCDEALYSVKLVRNGVSTNINRSGNSYTIIAQDGDKLNIVARDPDAAAPVTVDAVINFTSGTTGLSQLLVNNEAYNLTGNSATVNRESPVTLVTSANRNSNPHVYYLPIVKGVVGKSTMTDAQWDAYWNARVHEYEYDLDKSKEHPVVPALTSDERDVINTYKALVPFTNEDPAFSEYAITNSFLPSVNNSGDNIDVTFKEYTYKLNYTSKVTFTVNIPDAITIQDVSADTPVDMTVSSNFQYTFNAEYPYANIDVKPGYKLTKVIVNNGSSSWEQNVSDNYVHYLSLGNNYTVAITVEVDNSTAVTGTATIKIVGDSGLANVFDVAASKYLTLNSGNNQIDITGTSNQYYVMAAGALDDFYDITLNGVTCTKSGSYYDITLEANDVLAIYTKNNASFTINVSGDVSKIGRLMDENRAEYDVQLGENVYELPNATSSFNYMLNASSALYVFNKNGQPVSPQYGSVYMFSVKAGDVIDIETEFPVVDYNVTWAFAGDASADMISAIQIGDGERLSADSEDFESYLESFVVSNGVQVQFWLDNSTANLRSVKINGVENGTNTYQYFTVTDNTTVTIDAVAKKVFNYTLRTNDPRHLMVYEGMYGYSQNISLKGEETVFEYNEITGKTQLSFGPALGYYVVSATMDGATLSAIDGHYTVTPVEDCVIDVTIEEVPRPYKALLYIDDLDNYNYVALSRYRGTAISTAEEEYKPVNGYNEFRFNDDDVRANDPAGGFSLNVALKSDASDAVLYINGKRVSIDESGRVAGIMLKDGDVLKLYCGTPETHNVAFSTELDPTEVSVVVDRWVEHKPFEVLSREASNGTAELLHGTEVTITVTGYDDAWVVVDGEKHELAAGSYTFETTADHQVVIGAGETQGIVMPTVTGSNDVYNLQGVLMMRNATAEQLRSLAPGIYIVGNRKVNIK